jgi:diguanylate cyclase (GGDEF)-like protein
VLATTIVANQRAGGTLGRTDLQLLLLVLGFSGNAIGVLERLRRAALGRARELAALFEASPDLVAIVDDENRLQWVNPSGRALLDRAGTDVEALAHGGMLEEDAKEVALQRGSWRGTVQLDARDGPVLLSQMVVRLPDEHGRRVGVVARDVTDLHNLTDQLRRLAFTDELTGLANRARLIERLGYALASTEPGAKQSLVLIDIDRFSRLNDHRGHDVGDAALQGVADRLRSVVRSGELLARVGDDRFAVLVENVHDEFAAVSVAERLRAAAGGAWVGELGGPAGPATELSVSAGVVLGGYGDDPDVMLRQADLALQRSKAAGGARSSAYDESLSRLLVDRVRIEVLLRESITGRGWPVRYQPVVDLRSGEVLGCEALLEPLAPPLEVVAVAEELGLIGALSEQVLRTALDQSVLWRQRKAGFKVGVNVSAIQLADPVLPGRIHQELSRAGLPGDALVLEVTETAFTEDAPLANRAAMVLRDMGVQVSIDDFGTGFSSLSRLRSLPVDEIKLDRTFVADIGRTDGAESIIAAVVAMTSALDLKLVAEGVEEEHQRQALVDLGCRVGQGWLFAYPMSPDTFDAWLDSHLATR